MTIAQVLEAARNNLSAVNDTNWGDSELYVSLFQVMLFLARKTHCIDETDSSITTVAATATYAKPAGVLDLWRVTYDGKKLQKLDWREYDSINPSGTTTQGSPSFYLFFEDTFTLFPTPDDAKTVKLFFYAEPTTVPTALTTLSSVFPSTYHDVLVTGLTYKMCPKDLGHPLTQTFRAEYADAAAIMEQEIKKRRRADRFSIVKCEENLLVTDFGIV